MISLSRHFGLDKRRFPQRRSYKCGQLDGVFKSISDEELLVQSETLMYTMYKVSKECNRRGIFCLFKGGLEVAHSKHVMDMRRAPVK